MKFKSDIEVQAGLKDSSGSAGSSGQILSSTASGVSWINQISLTGYVPYTGATTNVDLGTHTLSSYNLIVNHTSGSGVAASITKGGNGEALTINKTSGSGNAMSVSGGLTSLVDLTLSSIANATIDTDKFIVSDSGAIKYRTGAQVLSDIGGQAALTNPITGTGTTNYLPKFTGSTAVGNSVIYETGGSIGIGTTSPSAKLHVAGSQILDDGAGRITLALGSTQNEIYSTTTGFAAYSNLRISASNTIFTNAGAEVMRITSSGTIGIGTTTPGAALHVQGSLKVDSGPFAFLLVDSTEGILGAEAGNGGFSYAGGGPGVGGAGDSMAALTSRNVANSDDAVFGLQGYDSSTGQEYFFTAQNVLKSSGPSDPSTPKRYMEVYDMNSGVTYWINLYQ